MKRWMEDYFSFSRKDRIAIWVLVLLIFVSLVLPYFFNHAVPAPQDESDTAWIALARDLEIKQDSEHLVQLRQRRFEKTAAAVRYADSGREWKRRKYPDRNGNSFPASRFYKPRLSPIDINLADTTAFIALPGIGSRLADRIIRFREKLGGFHSIDQISEVYGLADTVFQQIRPLLQKPPFAIKRININTAGLNELKAHPYIRYAIANSIVRYRDQHGAYTDLEDLKKIMLITEEIYNRIFPYLTATGLPGP
jgi:DNA uptake protein ComE-like DNA-binding protein